MQTKTAITLTPEQQKALRGIDKWLDDPRSPVFQLRGPAGTGKSTLLVRLMRSVSAIALAFQGKAVSVLRRKGATRVSTIHSFLYGSPKVTVRSDGSEELEWRLREDNEPIGLIALDEVSQIDAKLGRDLLSQGAKILTFGDSIQLPPIDSRRAFFDDRFGIDVELAQIHRQARNSPVLRLATKIREGGALPKGIDFDLADLVDAEVVITAFRETRRRQNFHIRRRRYGIRNPSAMPLVDELVIATRTSYPHAIYNGTIWQVVGVREHTDSVIELDLFDEADGYVSCRSPKAGFNSIEDPHRIPRDLVPFDFAYAITCHRAQGSEWSRVAILDESRSPGFRRMAGEMPVAESRRRWLYTAVTRAAKQVDVIRFS